MKVAIIGAGFLAETRARCWRRVHAADIDGLRRAPAPTVMVAAREREKAQWLAECTGLHGGCTIDEAFADPSVTLVDLCVPNRIHRELCERAAAAGKHVLCTKPLTAYWGQGLDAAASVDAVSSVDREIMLARAVEDADAMVDACRRAGTHLFYGENWCFAPAITRAVALGAAAQGAIVEMRGWESHSGSHSPYSSDWRQSGGGALLRLGAHPIGAMLWLKVREGMRLRRRPTRVVSVTAEVRAEGSAPESWGVCTLKFDDGSVGVAYGSDHMLGGMQSHLTVLSTSHCLECSLSPVDMLRAYAPRPGTFGDEYIMEKVDSDAGWSTPMPDEDWTSGHQSLVQSVTNILASGGRPVVDGALGAEVVRVIYAAYQSAASGRRVELAEREGRNALARLYFRATVLSGACDLAADNASLPPVFREARRLLEQASDEETGQRAACALLTPFLRCTYDSDNSSDATREFLGLGGRAVDATAVTIRRVEFDGSDDVPLVSAQAAFEFHALWRYTTDEVARFEAKRGYLDHGLRFWWDLASGDPGWSGEFTGNSGLSFEYFG